MSESALDKIFALPSSFQSHWALLARYLRPQGLRVALMSAFLLAGIAVKLANPQVLRYFLDTAQAGGGGSSLLGPAGLFIVFAIIQQGMSLATHVSANAVGWTATNALRVDLARHLLSLDMPFHKSHTPGELIDRVDGDVTLLANFLSRFSINILGDSLLLLGILILLFREDPWVGLGMILYTGLTLLVLRSIQRIAVPRWMAERQAGAELYGYIEERISGAEEIRAAGAEASAMRRLYGLMRTFTEKTRAALVVSSLTYNLTNLVYVIGYAAGLAFGVILFSTGQASLGTAYLVTYYIGMLSDPLQSIRSQAEDLQQATASIQRVQEFFALKPLVSAAVQGGQTVNEPTPNPSQREGRRTLKVFFALFSAKKTFKNTPPHLTSLVRPMLFNTPGAEEGLDQDSGAVAAAFEHVSFRYEDEPGYSQGGNVLEDVSFAIQPGRVLGILGRTGSGKSTLTRLLFRLYDSNQGTVRLGGMDVKDVPLAVLRRRVGMVTQDVQLFQASLRDNLTLFNQSIPDSRLQSVLTELRLWEWVQTLPKGLDTPLAGGQSLSAGEAQLLAFGRVFLKDPGLVILDEASSRLDPSTEALMERSVDRLFEGRTGVVIAHRLKTVLRADDILILEEGRVVEYGPRQALAGDPSSRFAGLLRMGLEEVLV